MKFTGFTGWLITPDPIAIIKVKAPPILVENNFPDTD